MDRRGWTLAEVLVVSAIASLVGAVLLVLATTSRQMWMITDAKLVTMTDSQRALDRLSEELRATSQNCLAFAPDQVSFAKSDGAGGCDETTRVTYWRNPATTQLIRTLANGTQQVITSGLTEFFPTGLSGGLVRVNLTVQVAMQANMIGGAHATQAVTSQMWVQNP